LREYVFVISETVVLADARPAASARNAPGQ
jgi:hypothetical protein